MKVLKDQTLYQCDYCKKRLLTKAGARLHENDYCWHPDSPHHAGIRAGIREKQDKCKHDNVETHYSYIPGEAVKEPSHDECLDCGKILY